MLTANTTQGTSTKDPYWAFVALLVKFNQLPFTDHSPANHAIFTRTTGALGGTATASTADFKFGRASYTTSSGVDGAVMHYNSPVGTTGNLTLAGNDFTIEAWVKLTSASATARTIIGQTGSGSSTLGWKWHITPARQMVLQRGFGTALVSRTSSTVISLSVWHHLAVVKKNNVVTFYLDGVADGSSNDAGWYNWNNSAGTGIGCSVASNTANAENPGEGFTNGYIDELRVTRYARYTTDFSVPTSEFPVDPVTTLSFPMEAVLAVSTSPVVPPFELIAAHSLVAASVSPARDTTNFKFGTSSNSFDGSTQAFMSGSTHLLSGRCDIFQPQGTVEGWFRPTSFTSARSLIHIYDTARTNTFLLSFTSTGVPRFEFLRGGSSVGVGTGPSALSTNTWYHIAVSVIGKTARLFVNGVQAATVTLTDFPLSGPSTLMVGSDIVSGTQANYFVGNMDDLRFTRNQAIYWDDFSVPTAALTSFVPYPPSGAYMRPVAYNTFTGSNGSTPSADNLGNTVSVAGSPAPTISTDAAIEGTTSMKFGPSNTSGVVVYAGEQAVFTASTTGGGAEGTLTVSGITSGSVKLGGILVSPAGLDLVAVSRFNTGSGGVGTYFMGASTTIGSGTFTELDNFFPYTDMFTLELWFYQTANGSVQVLVTKKPTSSNNTPFELAISASNMFSYRMNNTAPGTTWAGGVNVAAAGGGITTPNVAVSLNTWHHVALVRAYYQGSGSQLTGGFVKAFFDGKLVGITGGNWYSRLTYETAAMTLGAAANGSSPFNGYIDGFKMIRGVALYTGNFVPKRQ
jgi:hypothetical protein